MMETVTGADYVILVVEPASFGFSDLKVAVEVLKKISIPAGLVINGFQCDDIILTDYALKEKLGILLKLPYSKEFTKKYSEGD